MRTPISNVDFVLDVITLHFDDLDDGERGQILTSILGVLSRYFENIPVFKHLTLKEQSFLNEQLSSKKFFKGYCFASDESKKNNDSQIIIGEDGQIYVAMATFENGPMSGYRLIPILTVDVGINNRLFVFILHTLNSLVDENYRIISQWQRNASHLKDRVRQVRSKLSN